MESEKAKEIKKVLEEGQFNTIIHHQKEGKPIKISFADILTLINDLESENERLKTSEINSCQELDNACTQIHSLETCIAELEKENANLLQVINDLENIDTKLQNTCAICEAELKHFAEMLRGKAIRRQEYIGGLAMYSEEYVKIQDVDETLKECINGKV